MSGPRIAGEAFKPLRQLFACCGTAINQKLVAEAPGLVCGERPVSERRDVRVDQPLLVGAPAGRMIGVAGMVEDGDAEYVISERALDVAPRGALLFACPVAQPVRVEVSLARIGF